MPDKFDPYREALVMETITIWSDEYSDLDSDERRRIEEALHGDAESCGHLEYLRPQLSIPCPRIVATQEASKDHAALADHVVRHG